MKRFFTLLAFVAVGLVGCKDDNKSGGKLDPSAKMYINASQLPQTAPQSKAGQAVLTPKQVVEQAERIIMSTGSIDVDDWNRDVANTRFVVGSGWVISDDGDLAPNFIEARNYIFVTLNAGQGSPKDTIAYIPNATMQAAEQAIKAAYTAANYTECYRLLQEAFVFTPTTGAEWRALKAVGNN